MRRLFLRYCYGFYKTLQYLADNMGEVKDAEKHESAANEFHRQWTVEKLQPRARPWISLN